MEEVIKRVLEEKSELDSKILKLQNFLASNEVESISARQMSLLNVQESIMQAYSQVLVERLTELLASK